MDWLRDRTWATLAGAAIGDALGGATEGWTPEQIRSATAVRVTGIVGPLLPDWRNARPIAPYHKGDGHITDDTLMTHALVQVYADAADAPRRVRRGQRPGAAADRRAVLDSGVRGRGADPAAGLPRREVDGRAAALRPRRPAGGRGRQHRELRAAMYVAPVGVVNATSPAAAYAEAIDLAGAHQSSYGREAAGVFAAAVAAALTPGATVDDVIDAALAVAHDGTPGGDRGRVPLRLGVWPADARSRRRSAGVCAPPSRPYDTVGDEYRAPELDARRPSRGPSRSRSSRWRSASSCTRRRLPRRDAGCGQLRPGRRLDRDHGGRGLRRARAARASCPRSGCGEVEQASRIDLDAVADQLARRRPRSSRRTWRRPRRGGSGWAHCSASAAAVDGG